jgi:hypothetical protein
VEYTHSLLDETVEFLSGSYEVESENRLPFGDREVLYLVGNARQVCGCCGTVGTCGTVRFITVPGFIKGWKTRRNESGVPVSEIELINDEETRVEITRLLQQQHGVTNVGFW